MKRRNGVISQGLGVWMNGAWLRTTAKFLMAMGLSLGPASLAFAQKGSRPQASAKPSADSTWCLLSDGTTCQVATQSVGFAIQDNPAGSVLVFYVLEDQKFVEHGIVEHGIIAIENDLDQQLQFGAISEQEAQQIRRELSSRVDVSYHLPPTPEAVLKEVGFSLDTKLTPEDDIDMLKVHLQLVLGVGPVTASYLIRAMGVAVVTGSQDLPAGQGPKEGAPTEEPTEVPAEEPAKNLEPSEAQPPIDPENLPAEVPDAAPSEPELLPVPKVIPSERLFVLPDELHILYCTQS